MYERGIPVLELDVEYGERANGQTRTRIEAFLEMLQGRGAVATGTSR
jgi:benzoyl-CoA reductase/2-hydroxyglutaryl-CoA dehydratase subunit BcrC/BadD/HgdB